jgi:hypothetical protein
VSANKRLPHVLVLPEDDANRQLANGFRLELDWARQRQMQVDPVAGGWLTLLELFVSDHIPAMARYPNRFVVLLIDFDRKDDRLDYAKSRIPDHLEDRIFILGVWSEPEDLQVPLEETGSAMARDCREEADTIWSHELLRHNASELARLRERVRPILFEALL